MEAAPILAPSVRDALYDSNIERKARGILEDMQAETLRGRALQDTDRLHYIGELVKLGVFDSFEPLLPGLLNLDGKPFTLTRHFPFQSLFNIRMPKTSAWVTARQQGKSSSVAAQGVLASNCIPNFKMLFVTPLYEQIRRFSNNVVRPLIQQSPVRGNWTGTSTQNSVLQRTFKNNSLMLFSFALLDDSRLRGPSADQVTIDEAQDFPKPFVAIVRETLSASPFACMRFIGTPKTLDNPLTTHYRNGSQAEWVIKCRTGGCGEWNIPALEYHLLKMLGPYRHDISDDRPGLVCHKCQQPLYPPSGHWVHRIPDRRWTYPSYHMSQPIVPMHYGSPQKWHELLRKQEGWGNTTEAQFLNEVCGTPVDVGQKLVTETELRAACLLPWANNPRKPPCGEAVAMYQAAAGRWLAIDWGGGGEDGASFTTLALLAYDGNGGINCVWGKRLLTGNNHMEEAKEVAHWFREFKCDMIAHDYTGAGGLRETVLIQVGVPASAIMAVSLAGAAKQDMIKYHPPSPMNSRGFHVLDKTRSLLYTCQAIKLKTIKFFRWDTDNNDSPGLIYDFLNLIENKTETRQAGELYTINKAPDSLDDFAQAVNIGCAGIWHQYNSWPNFAELAGMQKLTDELARAAGHAEFGWDEDPVHDWNSDF